MLGKIEGRKRGGHQRMRWLDDIADVMDMNFGKLWEMVRDRKAWCAAVHGITKSGTRLYELTIAAYQTKFYVGYHYFFFLLFQIQ